MTDNVIQTSIVVLALVAGIYFETYMVKLPVAMFYTCCNTYSMFESRRLNIEYIMITACYNTAVFYDSYIVKFLVSFVFILNPLSQFYTIWIKNRKMRTVSDSVIRGDGFYVHGNDNMVTGNDCIVIGNSNSVKGNGSKVFGNMNQVYGDYCHISGEKNDVHGSNCHIFGKGNMSCGKDSKINGVLVGSTAVPSESITDIRSRNKNNVCIICYYNVPTCAALPCGHLRFCAGCARSLVEENACPLCREPVTEFKYMHR